MTTVSVIGAHDEHDAFHLKSPPTKHFDVALSNLVIWAALCRMLHHR